MSRSRCQHVLTALLIGAAALLTFAAVAPDADWRSYGGNSYFQRYAPLDQINKGTLKSLSMVWQRPSLDSEYKDRFPDINSQNYLRATPILVNGLLYASNSIGLVEAFDPVSGKTKWIQKPFPRTPLEARGQSLRGVAYWKSGTDERIISVHGEFLYAMNARTGETISDFGDRGKVFLRWPFPEPLTYRATNGPIIVGDVVILGGNGGQPGNGNGGSSVGDSGVKKEAYPENIRGYDVRTGRQLWTFHIVPEPGEPGNDTWGNESWKTAGNMGNWGPMSADEKLGYVYVPLSAPTVSYYGGHRPGNNLYANSLVALNAKTGKLAWYFQMVHHDLWDYDAASAPVLGDIRVDGKLIHAVMAANKTGFLYVFDRETGKPVWPIEERPVPRSTVPGEMASLTQPVPTKPPPFDMQGITENDLIDFTPELHKEALELASKYELGAMFAPPSLITPDGKKGTLIAPGVWGSGNWNTGAFDPETETYYAVSRTEVNVYGMMKPDDPNATLAYTVYDPNPRAGGNGQGNGQGRGAGRGGRGNAQGSGEGQAAATTPTGPRPGLPQTLALKSGLPIQKPPYGRITAYDMHTGDKLWQVADGDDGLKDNPALKGLKLPPLGSSGRPAPLVTKSLFFLADSSDAISERAGTHGPAKFRAYDKATGEMIWETPIPAGATGAPMSYMVGGKQYIVLPIGGQDYGAGWVAFGLRE